MKTRYENKEAKTVSNKKLICLSECEAPGVGAWKPGDVIEDEKIVEYLTGNPNFKVEGAE